MTVLIAGTAVACAAMGGVFLAFSSFVMQALARMPPARCRRPAHHGGLKALKRYVGAYDGELLQADAADRLGLHLVAEAGDQRAALRNRGLHAR